MYEENPEPIRLKKKYLYSKVKKTKYRNRTGTSNGKIKHKKHHTWRNWPYNLSK